MNKQEVFNQVYLGLKSQGFKRSTHFLDPKMGTCRYRGINGRKCAIGHLISDQEYESSYEYHGVDYLLWLAAQSTKAKSFTERWKIEDSSSDRAFLKSLQAIHDYCDDIEKGLKSFAQDENLTIPEESK